jgi:hypothetical protein
MRTKVKTAIIALSAAALIAAATVLARNAASETSHQYHQVSKKHAAHMSSYTRWRVMHADGEKASYPGASGYAPNAPKDYIYDNSRNAGGGGGGSGM